jgi:hypothetical protein
VVLDDRFMFARGRGCQLEPAETLQELLQKADGNRTCGSRKLMLLSGGRCDEVRKLPGTP